MAYNQVIAEADLAGDVLEIGVHHGLSAIGTAALRGSGGRFVAVDLFDDLQSQNVSGSGLGNRTRFIDNMSRFHDDLSFLTTVSAASSTIDAKALGRTFSFCHIDGGHSAAEAGADLRLAEEILRPGGLVALDDYFNPAFPGVGEAAVRFHLERPGRFRPIAIGFNKVLFQREPVPFPLNDRLRRAVSLDHVEHRVSVGLAGATVRHGVRGVLRPRALATATARGVRWCGRGGADSSRCRAPCPGSLVVSSLSP